MDIKAAGCPFFLGLSLENALALAGQTSVRIIRMETPWVKAGDWRVIRQQFCGNELILTVSVFKRLEESGKDAQHAQ